MTANSVLSSGRGARVFDPRLHPPSGAFRNPLYRASAGFGARGRPTLATHPRRVRLDANHAEAATPTRLTADRQAAQATADCVYLSRYTQEEIAKSENIGRQTVSSWFAPNAKAGNRRSPSKQKTSKGPDAKVKLSPEAKKEAAARVIAAAEHATDSRVVDAPDVLPRQAGARDATPASQAQPSGIVVDAAATRNAPEPMKGLEG